MGRNNTMTVFGFWHGATQTDKWLRARDYFQIQYTDVSCPSCYTNPDRQRAILLGNTGVACMRESLLARLVSQYFNVMLFANITSCCLHTAMLLLAPKPWLQPSFPATASACEAAGPHPTHPPTYPPTRSPPHRPLQKYEPYTIMLRKHVPWFDERFRGYHFNKIVGVGTNFNWKKKVFGGEALQHSGGNGLLRCAAAALGRFQHWLAVMCQSRCTSRQVPATLLHGPDALMASSLKPTSVSNSLLRCSMLP